MEQSHSLKTPGTHSLGSWLAVRLPGLEEESYSEAGRGAWGERPPQEEAPEGRFGGSLGWGSASGRQGLRLPEEPTVAKSSLNPSHQLLGHFLIS